MSDYQTTLHDQARVLLALEAAIEDSLDKQSDLTRANPELRASLEAIRTEAGTQRQSLENYLHESGVQKTLRQSPIAPLLTEASSSGKLLALLSADYAAFNFAASEYSVLLELALRLYDPALRKLAPQHLRTYARAVQMLTHLLPSVVVAQLDAQGMGCRCICPMCSIGACGCRAAGHAWIDEAWQDARPQPADEPGLLLSKPRQGSQLAESGVRAGDRLLEVDSQPISTFLDVQKGIREHKIGEKLIFRIARGTEPVRDLQVTHVSDYPPS